MSRGNGLKQAMHETPKKLARNTGNGRKMKRMVFVVTLRTNGKNIATSGDLPSRLG